MKVTFIPADGVALVNGRAIHIDLSDFPPTIHAVQWNGTVGHIENNDGAGNLAIDSLAAFQPWLDRWEAARAAQDAPPPPKTAEQLAEEARSAAKKSRADYVAGIKVTTASGRIFDGDETSQARMARAIIALNAQPQNPVPTITWVLADNTPVQVTAAELTEALALAGLAQAAVWVI